MSLPTISDLARIERLAINRFWTKPAFAGDPRLVQDGDTEAGVTAVRDAIFDALIAEVKEGPGIYTAEGVRANHDIAIWLRTMRNRPHGRITGQGLAE